MQTVDLTPTWSDILPAMLAVLDNKEAPASSHEFIRSELENMAKVADKWVAHIKEGHERWLAGLVSCCSLTTGHRCLFSRTMKVMGRVRCS